MPNDAPGQLLRGAWQLRGPLAWGLLPVSLCFRLLVAARRVLYRAGLLPVYRSPVPVIVVGNVIAGGAGKTPVVMAVLQRLAERGIRAGVVARGYGRHGTECLEVKPGDSAAIAGDEPLLVRRACSVPVFVAARRVQAAQALLASYPETQVIISDDGLQHLALARDIEICVFDDRGVGNGWLLPAGPLREPWPRHADLVLVRPGTPAAVAGWRLNRSLAPLLTRGDGQTTPLQALRGQPVCALAAIARPEEFFAMLREQGLTLTQTLALPDHDTLAEVQLPAGLAVVCTRKDAVKLWTSHPEAWAVDLEVEAGRDFWHAFDQLLDCAMQRTLSLPHGSPTA